MKNKSNKTTKCKKLIIVLIRFSLHPYITAFHVEIMLGHCSSLQGEGDTIVLNCLMYTRLRMLKLKLIIPYNPITNYDNMMIKLSNKEHKITPRLAQVEILMKCKIKHEKGR